MRMHRLVYLRERSLLQEEMKGALVVAATVLLLCTLQSAEAVYRRTASYHDQIVIKCDPTDRQHIHTLLEEDFVDPWGQDKDGRLHFRLSVQLWAKLQDKFPECTVAIENVEEYVRAVEREMFNSTRLGADWFEAYHTYEEIVEWYQNLASNYKDIVTYVESIGKSFEGRDMPAVHFTTLESPKLRVYFQCQIHAREWISGAVCMYIANYICENYGKDDQVTKLLGGLEFVFIPFVNPDGYQYTWTDDRLWRKNRRINTGSSCNGVDLNRNYDDHWAQGGSSSNPCSETYHGASAASELETQNTQNYFKSQAPIIAAIDWHSYSQLILRPYGWTGSDCRDEDRLKADGDKMRDLAKVVHGMMYTSEKSIDLYMTSGSASDWFYGDDATAANKGYRVASYTIELRDTGRYGFELPPAQIIPNGQEMVPAALYLAESMLDKPLE